MSSDFNIRAATHADREAFYKICLMTSDNGADGSHLHEDKDVLGHIYAGPYLQLEPEFALALEDAKGVCGYCLATPDSERFFKRFVKEWLPPIQEKTGAPSGSPSDWSLTEQLHHLLLNPDDLTFFPPEFSEWPAHAHIDLLPRAQGHGLGRSMMEKQMDCLRNAGATGIHLCVAPENAHALAFYHKLGFTELPLKSQWPEDTVYLGKRLSH